VAGTPIYYVEDLLGTSRVTTTKPASFAYDADFYPYGGERAYTNTCRKTNKFEGKERDTETGNDDFGARYYSNRFGRWLSADWSASRPRPLRQPHQPANPQPLRYGRRRPRIPSPTLDGHDGWDFPTFGVVNAFVLRLHRPWKEKKQVART